MEYLHELTGIEAYLLICFLVFVEECGVPLPLFPGDVLLLAGGYLAAIHVVHISVLLVAAYAAAVAGATVCYAVSRFVGRPVVARLGRYVGLTAGRLATGESWLRRGGVRAVLLARVLPGTRINMSFAAGGLRLPFADFIAGVLASTALWVSGFTLLGFALGDRVTPLLPWYDRVAVAAFAVAAVAAVVVWRVRRRRRPAVPREPVAGAAS